MTGGDWGALITAGGGFLAIVFGFVLSLRRDATGRRDKLDAEERAELEARRSWTRDLLREVINPVRDWFAMKDEDDPVDFDRWTRPTWGPRHRSAGRDDPGPGAA